VDTSKTILKAAQKIMTKKVGPQVCSKHEPRWRQVGIGEKRVGMRVSGVKRQTCHIDVKGKLDGARPEKMQIDLKPRAHLGMQPRAKGLGFLKGLITMLGSSEGGAVETASRHVE